MYSQSDYCSFHFVFVSEKLIIQSQSESYKCAIRSSQHHYCESAFTGYTDNGKASIKNCDFYEVTSKISQHVKQGFDGEYKFLWL